MAPNPNPNPTNNDDDVTSTVDVVIGIENALSALKAVDVHSPEQLLELATPEAIVGACRWYDEQRRRPNTTVSTGLLVSVIREGGKPGYGQEKRAAVPLVTPKLLNAVRGRCLSPDGCRRTEVFDMFEDAAKRRGMSASELIDQAMGPNWQLTPPHPAMLRMKDGRRQERYNAWLSDQGKDRPDVTVTRVQGEDVVAYASRFWRVEDNRL